MMNNGMSILSIIIVLAIIAGVIIVVGGAVVLGIVLWKALSKKK